MKHTFENNTLTVYLAGRIDSSNAADVEKEILDIGFAPDVKVIVDMQDLEYISSAGLRVILRLKKSNADTEIINACSDVYEIFDMTGFTELMPISKAYREISVDGCEIIGEGANGLVYRIDADTIIKVYKNPDSLDEIHNERELARKAFVMGVPTAIPYDVVKVGELYGSVFELLNAKGFAKLLIEDPSRCDELAKESVEILKTIHSTHLKPGELPDKKQTAISWAEHTKAYIDPAVGDKLLAMIKAIPDTDTMLHGDYHIKNIMKQNGENLLIDMDTLAMGHPIFEFAGIFLAYVGFSSVDHDNVKQFLGIDYACAEQFWKATLKYYFEGKDQAYIDDVAKKAAMIGFTRLVRRTAEKVGLDKPEAREFFEYCKNYLETNIDTVDSLYFE